MAGEVSRHLSLGLNLPKPVRQNITRERLAILQQKLGARGISHERKESHLSINYTAWMPANANVNGTALPEWISLRALDPDTHARWSRR